MAFLSASNGRFDQSITGFIGIEMPPIHPGQNTWIALSSTASSAIAKSRNISIADFVCTSGLNEFIGFELSRVPEVESVFTALRADVFYAWILLENYETRVRECVYEKEIGIIDEFPMFDFDFYLVAVENQDAESMISGPVDLVYKKTRA